MTFLRLAPHARVRLDSERMSRFHGGSTHHLVLGAVAEDIWRTHRRMLESARSGALDWFTDDHLRYFWCDGGELWLRDRWWFAPTPNLANEPIGVAVTDRSSGAGVRIPLTPRSRPVIERLLPRLHRGIDESTVHDGGASKIVDELSAAGLVEFSDTPRTQARPDHGGRITLVGHSFLAIESASARVLVDPITSLPKRPQIGDTAGWLSDADAVVLSHPHWDHLCFESLMLVERSTPIIVPRHRHPASVVNIDLAAVLAMFGFRRIVELDAWETWSVADVTVTATPFHGEPAGADARLDRLTYHVTVAGRTVLGTVDGCRDEFGAMDDVVRRCRRQFGPIDYLFAAASEFHYPCRRTSGDRSTSRTLPSSTPPVPTTSLGGRRSPTRASSSRTRCSTSRATTGSVTPTRCAPTRPAAARSKRFARCCRARRKVR